MPNSTLSCLCGCVPKMETDRPPGRMGVLYQIVCRCGQSAPYWSASAPAAIRVWNKSVSSIIGQLQSLCAKM